jgi:catechol 2,3-dioxygenase-like lactoylglutathione lyase family enzyme
MLESKATFLSVTAMVPSGSNLPEALEFYTEQLGFSVTWQAGSIAGICRDGVCFTLVENNSREWAENSSYSMGVSDLEALYQEYKRLPLSVGPLEMKMWGRREFHIIVPSGVCFQFYAA